MKAPSPILVNVEGIENSSSFLHKLKHVFPIFSNPSFAVTDVKYSQAPKALSPIVFNVDGKTSDLIGVYWKAFCSIVFKPSFKITVSRELQLAKANSFIYFTLPGISIDSSFIQELKTWRSSDSSFDERVIDFNFEQ